MYRFRKIYSLGILYFISTGAIQVDLEGLKKEKAAWAEKSGELKASLEDIQLSQSRYEEKRSLYRRQISQYDKESRADMSKAYTFPYSQKFANQVVALSQEEYEQYLTDLDDLKQSVKAIKAWDCDYIEKLNLMNFMAKNARGDASFFEKIVWMSPQDKALTVMVIGSICLGALLVYEKISSSKTNKRSRSA